MDTFFFFFSGKDLNVLVTALCVFNPQANVIQWSELQAQVIGHWRDELKVKLWKTYGDKCKFKGSLSDSKAGIISIEFYSARAYFLEASNFLENQIWIVNDY